LFGFDKEIYYSVRLTEQSERRFKFLCFRESRVFSEEGRRDCAGTGMGSDNAPDGRIAHF